MATWLTGGVCLIIIVMLVHFWGRGGTIPQGPAILTMVGIAGTFLGIAIGLSTFNTGDITGSIPRLIDGMRTAVWASFAGVLSAIVLKYRDSFRAAKLADYEEPATSEGLGGIDDDSAVVAQLKLLGKDLGERLARIESCVASFERFPAERFTGDSTRANGSPDHDGHVP